MRTRSPLVLSGQPVGEGFVAPYLDARPTFRILLSDPTDAARFASLSSIVMAPQCDGTRIGLSSVRMRRVSNQDPPHLQYGDWRPNQERGDTLLDRRRIIELRPVTLLPRGCSGRLDIPLRRHNPGDSTSWRFTTYGPLTARATVCAQPNECAAPVRLDFSTPVRGTELLRRLRITPQLHYTLSDSAQERATWFLAGQLEPNRSYTFAIDAALTDVFGQRLGSTFRETLSTRSYAPAISFPSGMMLMERYGPRVLPVQAVNVDTLVVRSIAVPASAEARFLSTPLNHRIRVFDSLAIERHQLLRHTRDVPFTARLAVPATDARTTRHGTLQALQLLRTRAPLPIEQDRLGYRRRQGSTALIQVTNLAVHARVGMDEGIVWVTGVNDARPRAGVLVELHDSQGKVRAKARTDAQGFARLANFRPSRDPACRDYCYGFAGYVSARLNDDRALVAINSDYDTHLAPWRFQMNAAGEPAPIAAALFTERNIYRPGEPVYAKAIVRRGLLGALRPARRERLGWQFLDSNGDVLKRGVTRLSAFGTAQQSFALPPMQQVGHYYVHISLRERRRWRTIASTSFQIAEYHAPEFLVEMNADTAPRIAGDTVVATIAARYLFGGRMNTAPVSWGIQQRSAQPWELGVRGTDGWMVGEYLGYELNSRSGNGPLGTRMGTLDANGEAVLRSALAAPENGRPARVTITATVTDANRQTVTAGRQLIVHPAAFYIGARQRGKQNFWRAGQPVTLDVIAVRPTGERVADVFVEARVIRREWRQSHQMVNGALEPVGTELSDTVATCRVRTAPDPVACTFTPARGGSYIVAFHARDATGRTVRTSLWGWALGPGFSSWNSQSPFRVDLLPDRPQYSVGDTAALLVVSPFDNVEAWLTIERERILESRRLRLPAGTSTIRVPITEALTPNAFVSVLLTRGRINAPAMPDSLARPTLRVGYAELRVSARAKKLDVQVTPLRNEYQPADTARVRVAVKDVNGRGHRAEITLWAVDKGVLALTNFALPDPHAQIYYPRGLGVRLSSNLTSLVPRAGDSTNLVPRKLSEWEEQAIALSQLVVSKGLAGAMVNSSPVPIDAAQIAAFLRSRFRSTAFFLGSVLTDEAGQAIASVKLPDNLTTFRIMAVAVTEGDLYGSGQSSLLVSRPLLARPSLPRFLRAGDRFSAGVVVNQRTEGTQRVDVQASSAGTVLLGEQLRSDTLRDGAGREVRFDFLAQPVDTARFQFAVRGRRDVDAVTLEVPIRPSYHPLAQTMAGALRDTASVEFALEQDVDPTRSRLELSYGSSTLSILRGVRNSLQFYPYSCTEQASSSILPVIALYRVQRELRVATGISRAAEEEIRMAIRTIATRQRNDGAIALWPTLPWSTPTLTANATRMLLEARDAGFAVDSTTLNLVRKYLLQELRAAERPRTSSAGLYTDTTLVLSERLAAVDVLSRLGHPEVQSENALFERAHHLRWEDRVLLAEVMARRGATQQARSLLAAAWSEVRAEGRTLALPTGSDRHYFLSTARPAARLLTATLALEPDYAQIGTLVETLVQQGRALSKRTRNTQDYGAIVLALLPYERMRRRSPAASVHIRGASGTLFNHQLKAGEVRDTSVALTGLLTGRSLRLTLTSSRPGVPVYYFLTVREVPNARPVNPVDRGIQLERWYESIDTRRPVTTVAAGDLVRVRLRITVPVERHFVVMDDPLPAGIEVVDPSLRTVNPFGLWVPMPEAYDPEPRLDDAGWYSGSWGENGWSAFDYKELRDDRVIYFARMLWKGSYTATYLARATTAGTFVTPPAHAEEMYNPAVNGRTGGGLFVIR
jgi:alpha-2-macroglobulin